jgi:hypothetical protein
MLNFCWCCHWCNKMQPRCFAKILAKPYIQAIMRALNKNKTAARIITLVNIRITPYFLLTLRFLFFRYTILNGN